jgi:hypothetical protein
LCSKPMKIKETRNWTIQTSPWLLWVRQHVLCNLQDGLHQWTYLKDYRPTKRPQQNLPASQPVAQTQSDNQQFLSMFSMTLDRVDEEDGRGNRRGKKQQAEKKTSDEGNDGNNNSNKKKGKKQACFICDEERHFAEKIPAAKPSSSSKAKGR